MIAVHLDRVTFTYISEPIFQDLSWEIHTDRVAGLIGPNGCGKSTLLKLIAGTVKHDSGFINRQSGLTIGYLSQEPQLEPEQTVLAEVMGAFTALAEVETELAAIETRLGRPEIYNNPRKLARPLDRQAWLLEEFTRLGGPGFEGHVRSVLHHLGFQESDFELPIRALSGGQKKLAGLASLMVTRPDLLLLDEPDNHLDLAGKDFLAGYIRNYAGAVVIVSHDRYLLDLVVDEIVELEDGHLSQYLGNYSEYAFEKQAGMLRQQQLYQAQQKEITRLEQSAKRLLTWGKVYDNPKFIRRGQNIIKRLDRMDKIDQPVLERKQMGLELAGWRGSNKVLEIQDLGKVFPTASGSTQAQVLFTDLNLLIRHGQRVGLVGPNGAGKSVLFRLILGEETASCGQITLGPSVQIGYYAQEHQTLDYGQSLIETVRYAGEMSEPRAVAFLGRFLFNYEQARGKVGNLSGGERSRLQMALLMLSGANFLMLDEPTNNLDINSAEALEEALAEFQGTVLVISHDRYFLDRVVDQIIELEAGLLSVYPGTYSDYQEAKNQKQS